MVQSKRLTTGRYMMAIWYHDKNVCPEIKYHMQTCLYQNFSYSRTFDNESILNRYLSSGLVSKKIVFILTLANKKQEDHIESMVKKRYCGGIFKIPKELYIPSNTVNIGDLYKKLKDTFCTIITQLCPTNEAEMDQEIDEIEDPAPILGTLNTAPLQNSFCDLNTESLRFLLFQSLIQALLNREYKEEDFNKMWTMCRRECKTDNIELEKVRTMASEYTADRAINCYTRNSYLFKIINRAFRMEDVDKIYRFGCYLNDLHRQLDNVGTLQRSNNNTAIRTVYRGKRYTMDVIQQFKDNEKHIVALHGLISTSRQGGVAEAFAGTGVSSNEYYHVVFTMHIDPTSTPSIRPYADVTEFSEFEDEEEVLFFTGFVWEIRLVENISKYSWSITLDSCADYNPQLVNYIIESNRDPSYLRIGKILHQLGDYTNASNFYARMLREKNISDKIHAEVLCQKGMLASDKGEYMVAIEYFQEAAKLTKREAVNSTPTLDQLKGLYVNEPLPSRLKIFYNMGLCYLKDEEYENAKQCFASAIKEAGSNVDRATVLNSYGLLEISMDHFENSIKLFQQAKELLTEHDTLMAEVEQNIENARRRLHVNARANTET